MITSEVKKLIAILGINVAAFLVEIEIYLKIFLLVASIVFTFLQVILVLKKLREKK